MALSTFERNFIKSFHTRTNTSNTSPESSEEEVLEVSLPSHEGSATDDLDDFLVNDSILKGKIDLKKFNEDLKSEARYEPTSFSSSGGRMRPIGVAGRGVAKDLGDLADLPFLPHNLALGLIGNDNQKNIFSEERMGKREVANPRDGDIIAPVDLKHVKPLSFGVGDKAVELYDKVTDSDYIPQTEEEQKIAEYAGMLGAIFTPGGASKIVKSILKSAPSLKAGLASLEGLIKKITPETVKKIAEPVGEVLKKAGKFITRPGTKADLTASVASKYVGDKASENLDMENPGDRALALGLGLGTDVGLRKAGNLAEGAMFKNIINKEKLDLAKKYDLNLETSQLVDGDKSRSNALQFVGQNIVDNPFVGGDVRKKRIENIKDIEKTLDLENVKVRDPESASPHLRNALNEFKKERAKKSNELYNKAFGVSEKKKDSFTPIRPTADLSGDEFQKRVNEYLASTRGDKKSQAFFTATPEERIKILDEFARSDGQNKKQFKIHDGKETIEVETDKRNLRPDRMVPNHLLEEISKNSDLIGVPPQIKSLIEHIKRNNGTITVENYERYRKMLNKIKHPSGDSFYDAQSIAKFRDATRLDMQEKLQSLSPDRLNAFNEYLKHHSDWYSKNPKKLVQNKLLKMQDDSDHTFFKKIFSELKSDNKLKDSYISKLDKTAAKKLSKELFVEMAFHPDAKSTNLYKWARKFNDFSKEKQHFLQEIYSKAHPGTKAKLSEVSDLILQAKSTFHHANTSRTAIHSAFNKLIMPDPNVKGASSTLSSLKNFKWTHLPIYAAKNIVIPIVAKTAAKKYLSNPEFIEWASKGNDIKGTTQFLSWVNEASKYNFISKSTMQIIQKTFLDKMKELKDE